MSKPTFDAAVGTAIKDIQAGRDTRWVVMGYEKQSDRIVVVDKGNSGLEDVVEEMNDGKVLYAYIRYDITGIARYCFIGWCGDGVQGMRKGNYTSHAKEVELYCKPTHATVHARNEKDVDDASIKKLLTKAMGANYDAGGKVQGTKETGGTKKEDVRAVDNFAVSKEDSAKYWAAEKEKEESRKKADEERVKQDAARLIENQKSQQESITQKYSASVAAKGPAPKGPAASSSASSSAPAPKPAAAAPTPAARAAPAAAAAAPSAPARAPAAAPRAAAPAPPPPEPEPVVAEPEPEPEPEPVVQQEEEQQQQDYQEEEQQQQQQQEEYQEQQQQEEYPADQAAEEQVGQDANGGQRYKALYAYDAQDEGELSFQEGEIIWVLNQDTGGWWTGQREDYTTGLFPGNYVEPCDE